MDKTEETKIQDNVSISTVDDTLYLNIEDIIKPPKQTICLAMIVKNETKVLERCFDSLYNDKHKIINYWVICDTGSTDGTQELIKNYWEKKGVPGELHQHEWRNFGHNRSLLMKLAKGKSDYIITLDADEVFKFDDDFVMPYLFKDMYLIWSHKGTIEYQRLQLVSDKFDWYYKGICHEYLTHVEKEGNTPVTKDIMPKMKNIPYPDGSRSSDPHKYKRDALIFEQALLDEPDNSRYIYYTAQSYRDCQEYATAIKYYKKRVEMAPNCNSEETYYAQYQIALCKICNNEPFESYAMDLLKAYNIRPIRLEAAHVFLKCARANKLSLVAFQTFKHIMDRPRLHTDDTSFITPEIYDWSMLNELALAAVASGFYVDAVKILDRIKRENRYPNEMKDIINNNLNTLNNIIASGNQNVKIQMADEPIEVKQIK
jgi:glycosyltransferase involved in cell wall biosynthesis